MQELEIHSLIPRFGLDGVAPEAAPEEQAVELPEAELAALPLTPVRALSAAARPAVMGKQGTRNVDAAAGELVRRAGHHRLPAGGR